MKILRSVLELRAALADTKKSRARIGFVPTMGALHRGHGVLVSRARRENEVVVVSVFVNPTQFNDPKDLEAYPKELEQDNKLCADWDVDFLFRPNAQEMYPDQFRFRISETELSQKFCGRFRPGHFEGMLTVVLKLLQIVGATHAYFGEKDFQQLELVRQMARAFFLETSIVPCPTEREESGLALSSRNTRLSESEQGFASQLAVELRKKQSVEECSDRLRTLGFDVEYVEDFNGHRLAAVQYKNVRLIDNVPLAISVFRGQVDSKEVSHDSRS